MKNKTLLLIITLLSLGSASYASLNQDVNEGDFLDIMEYHETDIETAIKNGDKNFVAGWLAENSDPKENEFTQMFFKAISYGKKKIVKMFLNAEAEPKNYESDDLQCAIAAGHVEILKLLIKNGADMNARDGYALYMAARNASFSEEHKKQSFKMIELMIAGGADISFLESRLENEAYDYSWQGKSLEQVIAYVKTKN